MDTTVRSSPRAATKNFILHQTKTVAGVWIATKPARTERGYLNGGLRSRHISTNNEAWFANSPRREGGVDNSTRLLNIFQINVISYSGISCHSLYRKSSLPLNLMDLKIDIYLLNFRSFCILPKIFT